MTKQEKVQFVLNRTVTKVEMDCLKKDWKAFYDSPLDYKDTITTEMICAYLEEKAFNDYINTKVELLHQLGYYNVNFNSFNKANTEIQVDQIARRIILA